MTEPVRSKEVNSDSYTSLDDSDNSHKTKGDVDDDVCQTRARGTSLVARIRRMTQDHTTKIPLVWNSRGVVVCDNSVILQSYIGYLTRTRIPITFTNWKLVPNELKNTIIVTIVRTFECPHTMISQGFLLAQVPSGEKFKSKLNEYVKKGRKKPPKKFDHIDQDTWDEYLQQRCTDAFQNLSSRNSENARKIGYKYMKSREGYDRHEHKILKAREEDPLTSSVDRDDLWVSVRMPQSGLLEPDVQQIVKEIGAVKEKEAQGLIVTTKRRDRLCDALGKGDRPGQVRCAGLGVTAKTYYGETKGRGSRDEKVHRLEALVTTMSAKLAELKKCMMGGTMVQSTSSDQIDISRDDSCSLRNPPSSEEPKEVGRGRAFVPDENSFAMLHGKRLDSNTLKVTVETVIDDGALVPCPTDEVTKMKGTLGHFVEWPKCMVSFVSKSASLKGSNVSRKHSMQIDNECEGHNEMIEKYSSMLSSIDELPLEILMAEGIVHHLHVLYCGKDEIKSWLKGGELEAVHISIFIKYLYEMANAKQFGFLCRTLLGFPMGSDKEVEQRAQYIATSMMKSNMTGRLWFASYNGGNHWMLGVIDPLQSKIHWLDPLHGEIRDDFMQIATNAMEQFHDVVCNADIDARHHRNKSKGKKSSIVWKKIKGPKQPNNFQCGHYICRYMWEIIEKGVTRIPTKYFDDSPQEYSDSQIEDLYKEWLDFVETYIHLRINTAVDQSS